MREAGDRREELGDRNEEFKIKDSEFMRQWDSDRYRFPLDDLLFSIHPKDDP
jgi:hypothetical protein